MDGCAPNAEETAYILQAQYERREEREERKSGRLHMRKKGKMVEQSRRDGRRQRHGDRNE